RHGDIELARLANAAAPARRRHAPEPRRAVRRRLAHFALVGGATRRRIVVAAPTGRREDERDRDCERSHEPLGWSRAYYEGRRSSIRRNRFSGRKAPVSP